jgi:hypothetical protein
MTSPPRGEREAGRGLGGKSRRVKDLRGDEENGTIPAR